MALGSHALTPERFAALDQVYTAMVPLDRVRVSATDLAAARQTCVRLDRADALLGALRPQCLDVVTLARRARRLGDCRGNRGCRRASARLRRALTSYLRDTRSANRAIDAFVADPPCRLALRTSGKDVEAARRLRPALRLFERGLRRRSITDRRRAERRLRAIARIDTPSANQERANFRSACA